MIRHRCLRSCAALAVLTCGLGGSVASDATWESVLGDEGPRTSGRLIDSMTPGCFEPEGSAGIESWSDRTRRRALAALDLDPARKVRSAVTERTIRREGYSIDVVRIEVFPGLLLPANVYVPAGVGERQAPVVLTPTGCDSSLWSPHVQRRAANLASLGMVTVVTDGFCRNGLRRELPDGNPNLGYARQLLGLPGDVTVYLQELASTLTWAISAYPQVDPERIGVAGYSYGGQMAIFLAALDDRVGAVSAPATLVGESCAGPAMHDDLWAASEDGPELVWSAPLELPVLPVNWRLALLWPRPLHTTAGSADAGAHPGVVGEAIAYMRRLYGPDGPISYRTDSEGHHYGRSRREDTYEWLSHTLLDEPLGPRTEREVELVHKDELSPQISATTTLSAELAVRVASELDRKSAEGRTSETVHRLFSHSAGEEASAEGVRETEIDGVRVRASRVTAGPSVFPVFAFTGDRDGAEGRLLYLPRDGTRGDLPAILRLLDHYRTIVSIDYLGIGELESDRLLLHTLARYFMHNDPSLPQMNVALLRSWLRTSEPLDLYGCGWASSFYAAVLAHLEPSRVELVRLDGAPADELRYLEELTKVPDLLLQGGLFAELTVSELAAALDEAVVVEPLDTLCAE